MDPHIPTVVLNPIWVTDALSRPQKVTNVVRNGKFSQPFNQYLVRARASCGAVYPLFHNLKGKYNNPAFLPQTKIFKLYTTIKLITLSVELV